MNKPDAALPRITGLSWDIVEGCSPVSTGCKNCYAKLVLGEEFNNIKIFPERLIEPDKWYRRAIAFICENSDLFHPMVPREFIMQVIETILAHPLKTFILLTKRPERLIQDQLVLPANVWFGISAENQEMLDLRAPFLNAAQCHVKFVSAQPLLGPLNFEKHCVLDWIVIGGEYGDGARPMDEEWVSDIVMQAAKRKIRVLYQQKIDINGKRILLPTINGRQYQQYPENIWA